MTLMEMRNVTWQAIETYGVEPQLWVTVEEMSELTKEICKYIRNTNNGKCINYDNITTEIADVHIMLLQLQQIFGIDDGTLEREVDFKIDRLKKRLNGNGLSD